jgi:enoyl-CoA hydratase/carnithine racemase
VFPYASVQLARAYFTAGIARFVRKIGVTATTEMLLTSCELTAAEVLRVGVVTRVVPGVSAAEHAAIVFGALPMVA